MDDFDRKPERIKSGIGHMKKNQSDNPKAPLLKGSVKVDGREHWVAMFKSRKFPGEYDLSFEPKAPRPEAKPNYREELDDEVPF